MIKIKSAGIGDWFNPPEAQQNLGLERRNNSIQNAVRELSSIDDPQVQQIIQQLQGMLQG